MNYTVSPICPEGVNETIKVVRWRTGLSLGLSDIQGPLQIYYIKY
jgi:hypothetical protein